MGRLQLNVANIALHALHLGIVLGAGLGWLFCETRLAALLLQAAIASSWLVIGPLSGKPVGYCLVTDMQWRVRRGIGQPERSGGYVKFLLDALSGRDLDAALVDRWTARAFFTCLGANLVTLAIAGWC